jgi:hypothetical protein
MTSRLVAESRLPVGSSAQPSCFSEHKCVQLYAPWVIDPAANPELPESLSH